jgi:hypothetical protein
MNKNRMIKVYRWGERACGRKAHIHQVCRRGCAQMAVELTSGDLPRVAESRLR